MSVYDADKVRRAMLAVKAFRNLSVNGWAKAAGFPSENSLRAFLLGVKKKGDKDATRSMTLASVMDLAHAAGVDINVLIGQIDIKEASSGGRIVPTVPLINRVAAGTWRQVMDDYHKHEEFPRVGVETRVGPHAFALEVDGPSMEPEFRDGDIVIVDADKVEPTQGAYVVAKLDSDEKATFKLLAVKNLDRAGAPKTIELRPLNPAFPVQVIDKRNPGHIIGQVVEHHRALR